MNNSTRLASLMPLLLTFTAPLTHAAERTADGKVDNIIVTGKSTPSSTQAAAGAGFKPADLAVGPLGN